MCAFVADFLGIFIFRLQVVSTKVGGIPEVLPDDLIYLAEPNVPSLINSTNQNYISLIKLQMVLFQGLERAICDLKLGKTYCPYECNNRVREYYNWPNVTTRTEVVYDSMMKLKGKTLRQQLLR